MNAHIGIEAGSDSYDLAVVGAGIVGLGHALAAARAGLKVVVIERDLRANGASIRNFGFVTVTGQQRGAFWSLARHTRDLWAEVAPKAGIGVEHAGLILTFRRSEAQAVAEAFMATEMGEDCDLIGAADLKRRHPDIAADTALGALLSPLELRVESATALPKLTGWLAREMGVDFRFGTSVLDVAPPHVATSRGPIRAERVVVCPGDDFNGLFPDRIAAYRPERCRLTMVRLASPGFKWPAGVMSDLGLVRYRGYADLPEAQALKARLQAEQGEHLAHGVHLIAVQSADGSLVVGDSHHYGDLPEPFAEARTEELILDEYAQALGRPAPPVIARWTGVYAVSDQRPYFVDAPSPGVRVVVVTSGTGASISLGLGEAVIADLFGAKAIREAV